MGVLGGRRDLAGDSRDAGVAGPGVALWARRSRILGYVTTAAETIFVWTEDEAEGAVGAEMVLFMLCPNPRPGGVLDAGGYAIEKS